MSLHIGFRHLLWGPLCVMSSKPDGICINDDDVRLNVLGCWAFVSKYACTLRVRFNLWNSKVCYWRAINSFSLLLPGVFFALCVIVGLVFETNMEPRLLSVVKLFNGGRMCFPVLKRCINCLFFIFLFFLALCTLEHIAECSVHWQVELFDLIQDACGLSKQKRIFTILIFKELDDIC